MPLIGDTAKLNGILTLSSILRVTPTAKVKPIPAGETFGKKKGIKYLIPCFSMG
jgi:hypothetical protein